MSPDVSEGRMFQIEEQQMQRPPGKAGEAGEEQSWEKSERYGQIGKGGAGEAGLRGCCRTGAFIQSRMGSIAGIPAEG